ncbi:MAG TPA: V-type ATP synthase subunit A, partial [Chromatiaceae bacterium]|nr:V-type ATP synthase subunit A [Chromatiaceae bacterium]
MSEPGVVLEINGPLVRARLPGVANGEMVEVGELALSGEVIGLSGERALIQVYETTEMIRPGDPVTPLGHPFSVELGPGLLGGIFDGIQRPLASLMAESGDHIPRGLKVSILDHERQWDFTPNPELKAGEELSGGTVLGSVPETETLLHHVLVPPDVSGKLMELAPA